MTLKYEMIMCSMLSTLLFCTEKKYDKYILGLESSPRASHTHITKIKCRVNLKEEVFLSVSLSSFMFTLEKKTLEKRINSNLVA